MNINIGNVEQVVIPYHTGVRTWRKGWSRKLRLFGLYFYVSNVRMKKRQKRDLLYNGYVVDHLIENKQKLYERQDGKCPHCGGAISIQRTGVASHLTACAFP